MIRKFLALFFEPRPAKLEALTEADKDEWETLCFAYDGGPQVFIKARVR